MMCTQVLAMTTVYAEAYSTLMTLQWLTMMTLMAFTPKNRALNCID